MNWQRSATPPALVVHPPAASLDEAHLAIELWEFYSRKTLDSEQRLAVELMLAETADGRWAADTTGRSESRQNGKGDEIEVVELWGLTQRGEAILHTAHEAATAASAHERMVSLVSGHRDLERKVRKKQSWNGNYSLRFDNDAVIVWRTRTGAGGRGLDDISRIVVDEAQHAQPEELASALPILSVNPNPQKNFIGSGAVAGKSAFWWRLRRRAMRPDGGRFAWLEHSAEAVRLESDGRVVSEVGDITAPSTWRRANPAYPRRISHDFLLDQLNVLGPELFAREHLGVWDPEPNAVAESLFDLAAWAVCADRDHEASNRVSFALDVDTNAKGEEWCSIGASDGTHVEVVNPPEAGAGLGWVVPLVVARRDRFDEIGVDPSGPAGKLIGPLESAGVTVRQVKSAEFVQACGQIVDAVAEKQVVHVGQATLDRAVAGAARRDVGDGAWRFSRSRSGVDISPLVAVSLARYMALTDGGASVYDDDRGFVTLG